MHPTEQSTKPTQSRHLVITRHGHLPDTAERGDYHPPGCVHLGPGLSVEAVQPSPWPSGQCPASPLPESVRRTQNTELPTCWQKDVHSAAPSVRRRWGGGGGGTNVCDCGSLCSPNLQPRTTEARWFGGYRKAVCCEYRLHLTYRTTLAFPPAFLKLFFWSLLLR